MEEQILTLEHISLSYHTMEGETKALQDLNFSVKPGEFVALVGPSGCGKSTLAKILVGSLPVSEGKMILNGEDYTQLNGKEKRNLSRIHVI